MKNDNVIPFPKVPIRRAAGVILSDIRMLENKSHFTPNDWAEHAALYAELHSAPIALNAGA